MRPVLELLDSTEIEAIITEARSLLVFKGIRMENSEGRSLLRSIGLDVDEDYWVKLPESVIDHALETAPRSISLFDRNGKSIVDLEKDRCFDPGSTALTILDDDQLRDPTTLDYIDYVKVVDQLPRIKLQSTAMICKDVHIDISDYYRLYLSLKYSRKPIVTGTFRKESFQVMYDLLVAIRGSPDELRSKPLAIFDACVSSPLRWSDLTTQSVIDAAKVGIPSTIISMPMMGANAPASIMSTIIQHTAEVLSGVVLSQLTAEGAPVIWGGSASVFDLRKGTTPIGAIESMMITSGYAQVASSLGFPTHGYIGLTDTQFNDMQAGMETGYGMALASLAGVNLISGAGMLNFESSFSIEKLIFDHEVIGMSDKLSEGIRSRSMDTLSILNGYEDHQQLISHASTLKNYRKEFYFPDPIIARGKDKTRIGVRLKHRKEKLLASYRQSLNPEQESALDKVYQDWNTTG